MSGVACLGCDRTTWAAVWKADGGGGGQRQGGQVGGCGNAGGGRIGWGPDKNQKRVSAGLPGACSFLGH